MKLKKDSFLNPCCHASQFETLLRFAKSISSWHIDANCSSENEHFDLMLESQGLECYVGNHFIKSTIKIPCCAEKYFWKWSNVCPENSRLCTVLKTLRQISWICQQGWRLVVSFPVKGNASTLKYTINPWGFILDKTKMRYGRSMS